MPRRLAASLSDAMSGSRARDAVDTAEARALASIDSMHRLYAEQAARGVPEADAGLARIEQGRWPTTDAPLPQPSTDETDMADG